MPTVTMENSGAVLSMQARDKTLGDLRIEHLPSAHPVGASDIRFTKRVPLQSGSSWDVPTVVVALMDRNASWHDAADVYRDWAHTWMKAPEFPAWQRMQSVVNGPHTMQTAGKNCSKLWPSCESIPTELGFANLSNFQADGFLGQGPLKGSCGSTRVCGADLWMAGQMVWGHGCCYRFYFPDPFLGSEAELTQANLEIATRGGKVLMYTNGFNWDAPSQPLRPDHAGFPMDLPHKYRQLTSLNLSCPTSSDWEEINHAPCLLYDRSGEADGAGMDGYCNNEQPASIMYGTAYRVLCPGSKPWVDYLSVRTTPLVRLFASLCLFSS